MWATPIEEARLDDYVDREKVDTEKFDATVSGRALDAQARFNITNLVAATGGINPNTGAGLPAIAVEHAAR